jgi:stearoyl-CoA desaturase (Delta-9 desaturase)
MSVRAYRAYVFASAVLPFLAVIVAIVLLWNRAVGVLDLVLLAVFYSLSLLGLTAGYHRLLGHRSFKTTPPVRFLLGLFGSMAAEGPPITWVAHHRRHHATADHEGDPHSPHANGYEGTLRGLWHAHMGWLFDLSLTSQPTRYAPDLIREPGMRWLTKHFYEIVLAGIVLPGLIAFAFTRTAAGFLEGMLWGGLVRIFLAHHVTYAVASVGHYFGPRAFQTDDESRNVAWLAVPSFGDSWHNNHHAFPTSANHGLTRRQVDLSGMFIRGLERAGLAWDLVRIRPTRIESKEIDPPEAGNPAARRFAKHALREPVREDDPVAAK